MEPRTCWRSSSVVKAIDTTFLIQLKVRESPGHEDAHRLLQRGFLDTGNTLGLVPQVLEEFIHVCTDPRRFVTSDRDGFQVFGALTVVDPLDWKG